VVACVEGRVAVLRCAFVTSQARSRRFQSPGRFVWRYFRHVSERGENFPDCRHIACDVSRTPRSTKSPASHGSGWPNAACHAARSYDRQNMGQGASDSVASGALRRPTLFARGGAISRLRRAMPLLMTITSSQRSTPALFSRSTSSPRRGVSFKSSRRYSHFRISRAAQADQR
jgi:hypothetical protein